MNSRKLQLDHLDRKFKDLATLSKVDAPASGWVRAIRMTLGMSLQQLANKLSITRQSVQEMEKREKEGSITIRSLREIAYALDMKFVYGFVPLDGSLNALIERKAKEIAEEIVTRTSGTMKLEGQQNSDERLKKAIAERTQQLIVEMPKTLWD